MPMTLNDEQVMLANSVRPFLASAGPVSQTRRLRDSNDPAGYSPELWLQFAEMGFTGMLVNEGHGGLGLGHVEAGIVLEEIGRNLTPSPLSSTSVGAVTVLESASEELKSRLLPPIVSGESVAALAIDEGAHHGPQTIALRAARCDNGFLLHGSKTFVPFAHVADLIVVAARTSGAADDDNGITLFALEQEQAGLEIRPRQLVDASFASSVIFDGVKVDTSAVIGEIDNGRATLNRALDVLRTGTAAELLGVANGACEMTMAYLRDRKQFGQPIGSFQALQHRAALLFCELELARAAILKAQHLLDSGASDAHRAAVVAKALAGTASQLAVQEAVQMHGGIGMTDECDIGLFMKRQKVLEELYGNSCFQAELFAELSDY